MTNEERGDLLAWAEREGVSSEWYAIRAMALRLSVRGYSSDEIGRELHAWVDDAIKTLKRIEGDGAADTMPTGTR